MMKYIFFILIVACPLLTGEAKLNSSFFPQLKEAKELKGELVSANYYLRLGQFRSVDGSIHDFKLMPSTQLMYKGYNADLRHIPLGTMLNFHYHFDKNYQLKRVLQAIDNQATDKSRLNKMVSFKKFRGTLGIITKVEGKELTVAYIGQPDIIEVLMKNYDKKVSAKVCVTNVEGRSWNPRVDAETSTVLDVYKVAPTGVGDSGYRIKFKVNELLEGFRKGRLVRSYDARYKNEDRQKMQWPYGESLMNYGYGRLKTYFLKENPAMCYPSQFPFRTDYSNAHLNWLKVKDGQALPPFSEHRIMGELVSMDSENKTGKYRDLKTNQTQSFRLLAFKKAIKAEIALPDTGSISLRGKQCSFKDLKVGGTYHFYLYQDESKQFSLASYIGDHSSWQIRENVTYVIDKILGGRIYVNHLIPDVKNYDGDMETPPYIGRSQLELDQQTKIWKADKLLKVSDLKVGDKVHVNLNSKACSDIWILLDEENS